MNTSEFVELLRQADRGRNLPLVGRLIGSFDFSEPFEFELREPEWLEIRFTEESTIGDLSLMWTTDSLVQEISLTDPTGRARVSFYNPTIPEWNVVQQIVYDHADDYGPERICLELDAPANDE